MIISTSGGSRPLQMVSGQEAFQIQSLYFFFYWLINNNNIVKNNTGNIIIRLKKKKKKKKHEMGVEFYLEVNKRECL